MTLLQFRYLPEAGLDSVFDFDDNNDNMLVSSSVAEEKTGSSISAAVRDTISTAGVHTYTENDKRFALFFLLNGQQNLNLWKVTAESLPKYMNTFVGMPFIEDPNEGHFGIKEDTPTSEILSEQENYRKGTIVNVFYDPKLVEAVAVVEITDDDLWQRILSGVAIHVSPAITGRAVVYSDGSKVYDIWYGLHLARVKNPAYGVMHASLQKTCQGSEVRCIKQLMSMASANNVSFKPYPMMSSCSSKMENNNKDDKKNENEIAQLRAEIATLNQSIAEIKKSSANKIAQPDAVPPGEKQVPAKGNEDDKEDNDNNEIATLRAQVAEFTARIAETEEKEKKEMAQEITDIMIKDEVAAEKDKEAAEEELMKNDKASLTEKLSFAQKYHAVVAQSKATQAMSSFAKPGRTINYASTASSFEDNSDITYEKVMEMMP